jgi:hypothetical protein
VCIHYIEALRKWAIEQRQDFFYYLGRGFIGKTH